nr:MAG: replication associated protein [Arizlama virus]
MSSTFEFSFETGTIVKTDSPKDLDLPEIDETKFRLSLRKGKLILTYKTHIPKDLFKQWMLQKGKSCNVWTAHETADENNPYEHSHVLIMYDEALETRNCRYFDFQEIHPNIKKIVTKKHLLNVLKYMCKEDKSLEGEMSLIAQQEKMSLFEQVAACTSKAEVLKMAETPMEVGGLLQMYALRDALVEHEIPEIHHKWQLDLDEELLKYPHPRKIIWIFGLAGNEGKTEFVLHHTAKYNSLCFTQFGGARDAACMLQGADWNKRHVLVDLPRNAEHKSIYEPMEMIKNGLITSLKYQGGNVRFPKPHLVVFANFPPNVSTMSMDRWDIRELISVKGEIQVMKLDAHELLKMMEEEDEPDPDGAVGPMVDRLYDEGERNSRMAAKSY